MRALIATLVPLSLFALGCGEDLGTCDDPNQGRDTVLVNGVVMYGGQAIINKSCAGGRCHSSTATGESRSGAPSGLDFDLVPIREEDADGEKENRLGQSVVALKPRQLAGLRLRQRTVYDQRDKIWDQIRWGMMPPPASEFSLFLELKSIFNSEEDSPCEKGKAYSSLKSTRGQEVLRNWLACRAPIVESNGSMIAEETGGATGWQFPICQAPTENPDGSPTVVSLETLLEGPLSTCATCHPGRFKPDFTSLKKIESTVIKATDEVCDGKPYITKGEPENSFLYEILSSDSPGCGHSRMPLGGNPLTESDLKLVESWIAAGAPLTDADIPSSSSSSSD